MNKLKTTLVAKKLIYDNQSIYIELSGEEIIEEFYLTECISGKTHQMLASKEGMGYRVSIQGLNIFNRPLQIVTIFGTIKVTELTDRSDSSLPIHLLEEKYFFISESKIFNYMISPKQIVKNDGQIIAQLTNTHLTIEEIADYRQVDFFVKNEAGYYLRINGYQKDNKLSVNLTEVIQELAVIQSFSSSSLYLVEYVLDQYVATKIVTSEVENGNAQFYPLSESFFLLENVQQTMLIRNKAVVTSVQDIQNLQNVYIQTQQADYFKLTKECLTLLPSQQIQLFKKENQEFVPYKFSKKELHVLKKYPEIIGNQVKFFIKGNSIWIEPLINAQPVLKNNFSSLEIRINNLEEIALEGKTKELYIPWQKSGERFTLDLLETPLSPNQEYKIIGINGVTKQKIYLDLKVQPQNVLSYSLIQHHKQTTLITYDYETFIAKNYPVKVTKSVGIKNIWFEGKKLFLVPEKKFSLKQNLIMKRRGKNDLILIHLSLMEDGSYSADLSDIKSELEQDTKLYGDFYLQEITSEAIKRSPLKIKDSIVEKLPGKLLMEWAAHEDQPEKYNVGLYVNKDKGISLLQDAYPAYLKFMKKMITKDLDVTKLTMENQFLNLTIPELDGIESSIQLKVIKRATKETFILESKARTENDAAIRFDLTSLIENSVGEFPRLDFRLSFETPYSKYEECKLRMKKSKKRKEGLSLTQLTEEQSFLVYTTKSNIICGVFSTYTAGAREYFQVQTKLKGMKKTGHGYVFKIVIDSQEHFEVENAYLQLRSKEYNMQINCKLINQTKNEFEFSFEMDWDKFFPLYWDLFVGMKFNEVIYPIKVKGAQKEILNQVEADYLDNSVLNDDKSKIIYPYVTFSNDIAFMIREKENYENKWTSFKDKAGYLTYRLFKKHLDKQRIWLGFEKFSQTAQDNGYAMFDYVQKNNLKKQYYYVLSKDSKDYLNAKKEHKNILTHMSYRYFVMLYASKLLIASETPRHVHNIRVRSGRAAKAIQEKKSVFLQHGVTALKRSDVFKKSKGRGNFDMVVATSDFEKDILHENWLYDEDEIAVTGFSRWDLLEDHSNLQERKKIFVMPTWRSWMEDMPKEEFIKTDYYNNYMGFLSSSKLETILKENNLEIIFFLHPKFKNYISEFSAPSERVQLYAFGDIKVNEMIMASSLMISDYSSVTWDMFYMEKPVIFFQFDYEKYNEYEGSYIDMETELFGRRAITVDQLINTIEQTISQDFVLEEPYQELYGKYFNYHDRENSQRIYETIVKERVDQ